MNGFIRKKVGTLTLGEKLKKLRSERRMSLGEVSRQTRIQVKYLEYLEEGVYNKLPANVYVRGFLKSYAEFLGVDERVLLRMYDKEKEIKKNLERRESPNGVSENESREKIDVSSFVVTPKIIAAISIALLVFGGFFYLYREIGSFASTPRLVVLSPEMNYSTPGNSVVVEGVTDRDARVFLNGQPILVSDEGKFRENVTVKSGENVINLRVLNKFDKEALVSVTVQSTYEEKNAEDSVPDENKNEVTEIQNELNMEVRVDPGPVWVSVETDGNLVFSGTMLSGAAQSFQAKNKIVINSGKGNATFLKFNGKDIGALDKSDGTIKGAVFTGGTKF